MLIRGAFIWCPMRGEVAIVQDHLVAVDDDSGLISHFASATCPESLILLQNTVKPPTVVPPGSFLLPTFCDLHLHAPQFLYQGNGLHLPLMKWLDEYAFKAEERLDADPVLARKVYTQLAKRLIQNGTGSVLLFGTIKSETNLILAEVMQQAGLRAFVGKLSMDQSSRQSYMESSAESAIESAKSFVHVCRAQFTHLPAHRRLVEPVLTPRFVPTCSDKLLSGLGDLAESMSLLVQSHLAESQDQVQWVRNERGCEDLEVFQRSKLMTGRTVQAHCTYLDIPSLQFLQQRGTAVAHCPLSNAYFSARPFPLREALRVGVKVALGTDIAGGYSADIMNAMRQAVLVSRMRQGDGDEDLAVDWKETLYLATVGGITALGKGNDGFTVGKPFDAQQIQLCDPETGSGIGALDFFDLNGVTMNEISEEMVEKWWCLGQPTNRIKVWVQGISVL